jgi:hypothetical protein
LVSTPQIDRAHEGFVALRGVVALRLGLELAELSRRAPVGPADGHAGLVRRAVLRLPALRVTEAEAADEAAAAVAVQIAVPVDVRFRRVVGAATGGEPEGDTEPRERE